MSSELHRVTSGQLNAIVAYWCTPRLREWTTRHGHEVTIMLGSFKHALTSINIKLGRAPGTSPNLVRMKGRGIFSSEDWVIKDNSDLVSCSGGHIYNVSYPSGFDAIWKVHCSEAEMCGVVSPLDKTWQWGESNPWHGKTYFEQASYCNYAGAQGM